MPGQKPTQFESLSWEINAEWHHPVCEGLICTAHLSVEKESGAWSSRVLSQQIVKLQASEDSHILDAAQKRIESLSQLGTLRGLQVLLG